MDGPEHQPIAQCGSRRFLPQRPARLQPIIRKPSAQNANGADPGSYPLKGIDAHRLRMGGPPIGHQ